MKKQAVCLLISPVFNPGKANLLMMVRGQDPPLNLTMLAAYVRQQHFGVEILDCALDAPTDKLFRIKLQQFASKNTDKHIFIGIYVCTPTAYTCYRMAHMAKEIMPQAIIVAGGPHATFMYDEVLTEAPFTYAILGEGEVTLAELMAGTNPENIKGLAFRQNNTTNITPPRDRCTDINTLPMPAYDLLQVRRYRPPLGTFKRLPSFMLSFSRGCPNNCSFCTKTLGREHFQKTAAHIFKEVAYLYDTMGIRDFVFVDDTFTAFRPTVIEFCNLLSQSHVRISWHCYTRADSIDPDMLKLMKSTGCHQLMFGVESFAPEVLRLINKKITPELIENAILMTKQAGMACRIAMMVGNRGDTPQTLEHSLREIMRLKPDFISVLIATPGPGTPFFAWAEAENRLLSRNWALYTGGISLVKLDGITPEEVNRFYKRFWQKFYFNPGTIWRLLRYSRSIYQYRNLAAGFLKLVRFVFLRR